MREMPRCLNLVLTAIWLASCAAPALPTTTLTADGAWCWFADPRGVRFTGTRDCTYVGWVSSQGDIVVAQFDHATGHTIEHVVRAELEKDDHANPALLAAADGRFTVYYTKHAGKALYARTTVHPEDVTAWTPERSFRPNTGSYGRDNYCYPNPYHLTAENKVFLFWRGDHWKPTLAISADGGQIFDTGRIAVMRKDAGKGNRPYLKVASNQRDTIHLAFTDGHPRVEEQNSIYYARYRGGSFERADGSVIASLADLPIEPRASDVVYDGTKTAVRAWIWDVAEDSEGHPVIVYARLPSTEDHRYHYARFDGRQWIDHEIIPAGRWFPQTRPGKTEREPHYSGGIVLDHEDPDTVYLSRQVNGVFEIEQWRTGDGGATWQNQAITSRSQHDNVRPFVVRHHGGGGPTVIWMCLDGGYVHYTNYRTSLRMAGAPR